jgi:hypothetical protein
MLTNAIKRISISHKINEVSIIAFKDAITFHPTPSMDFVSIGAASLDEAL